MTRWFKFERQWLAAILQAVIPGNTEQHIPKWSSLDHGSFWVLFANKAPLKIQFALRCVVWLLSLLPIVMLRQGRLFNYLKPEQQDAFLYRCDHKTNFLLRPCLEFIKIVACFSYFHEENILTLFNVQEGYRGQ